MAYLSRIFIYPVKALDGVSVTSARVLPSGALADDRRYALLDEAGNYVNGKRNARVHLLRSTYDPVAHHLKLAAEASEQSRSFHIDSERSSLEEWLSEFFGFRVFFRENAAAGFPDDTESPGPTIIATATLREIASWYGLTLDQARARFRTNLEVEGVSAFWEDHLYGKRGTTMQFSVGDAIFDGINPCQRCVVPARDAVTGMSLPDFAKRFVEMRRKYLPKWAEASRFNHFYRVAINTRLAAHAPGLSLRSGDPVKIIGTTGVPAVPAAAPSRWRGQLRVARILDTAPNVRTFRLASSENCKLPFTYLPGQYLNIELNIDGATHRRCYTIASAPTRSDFCELTIKREENGTVSRYLHDHLREGMDISASGPGGKFTFTGDEADGLVLIGGGVGITPLMSVIRYLTDRKWPGTIDLIYSARTQRDIIFQDELKCLSSSFPNLRVTTTLTQEHNGHWPGLRGRITPDLLRRILPDLTNRRVHICGPIDMAHAVTTMLKSAGVPAEQIKAEAFGGPATALTAVVDERAPIVGSVTFADAGKSIPARDGQTVIALASQVGISIDRGCLAGICGRCKVRLISGTVDMDVEEGLTDCDKKDGFVLACQAKPIGSVAVDL